MFRRTFALAALFAATLAAQTYFPPRGQWEPHKTPAELGFDPVKLQEAVAFAQANGSTWDFDRDQVPTFGAVLGPLPKQRATTNGLIIRHGQIAAQFGDVTTNDPVYSVAKSFISTVASIAVKRGLIKDVNDPVARYIHDGGYDSPHNAKITWRNHLQQESEWEGTLWGKNADFVGHEQFGRGERKPREIHDPGTFYEYNDVRINRFALSLARVFGKGLPEVLKTDIMDPIGASSGWHWYGYANSKVEINDHEVESVSGGTRWGGGLWINSQDLARFGLLILNHGKWDGRQIVSAEWLKDATTPSAHGPDYGYLWWLGERRDHRCFTAHGAGGHAVMVVPDLDLVAVITSSPGDEEHVEVVLRDYVIPAVKN